MKFGLLVCVLIFAPWLVVISGCHSSKKVGAEDSETGTVVPYLNSTDGVALTDVDSDADETSTNTVSTETITEDTVTNAKSTLGTEVDSDTPYIADTSDTGTSVDTDSGSAADTGTHDTAGDSEYTTDSNNADDTIGPGDTNAPDDTGDTDDTESSLAPLRFPGCTASGNYTGKDNCDILLNCEGGEIHSSCERNGENFNCACESFLKEMTFTMPVPEEAYPCVAAVGLCNSVVDTSGGTTECADTEEVRWIGGGPRCESARPCTLSFELQEGIPASMRFSQSSWCSEDENGWQCMCYNQDNAPPRYLYLSENDSQPCEKLPAICRSDLPITINGAFECVDGENRIHDDTCRLSVECRQPTIIDGIDVTFLEDVYIGCNAADTDFECTCSGGRVHSTFNATGELTSVCETADAGCLSAIEWIDIADTDILDRIVHPDTD